LDQYIGKKFHMKKAGTEWKVVIDGVDYRISDDTADFKENEKVEVVGQKNAVFTVKKD
jgi:membrane protein implicated in regulation of membrane protease activity